MFNSGTGPYNSSLLLGNTVCWVQGNINMLQIIIEIVKVKNKPISLYRGKLGWIVLLSSSISDLLGASVCCLFAPSKSGERCCGWQQSLQPDLLTRGWSQQKPDDIPQEVTREGGLWHRISQVEEGMGAEEIGSCP